MKFAAAFALLAAVAAEELIEFDDSTLAGLSQDAREAALAELEQQAGVEEEIEDNENVMEQENAPEEEEDAELEAASDSDEEPNSDSDSEEEVELDADNEDESPSVAAKIEESEDWGVDWKKRAEQAKRAIHSATGAQVESEFNLKGLEEKGLKKVENALKVEMSDDEELELAEESEDSEDDSEMT